jgi:pimeloyl-ACP methyl ester carboxylesterase
VLRADVNGLSIAYRHDGDGPELVLLHGFLFDSRAWKSQLESLSNDFTVIAWDAPGAGQSDDPPEGFGIRDWAACLAAFLDVLDVRRAHIVGLSWGGVLAQELYREQPTRVRSLVLADTYAGWRGSLGTASSEERLAGCMQDSHLPPEQLVARYLPGMHGPTATQAVRDELAQIMSGFHPLGFRLMARAVAESDTRDLLRQIRVPTLLVWGEQDARSPLHVAHELERLVPTARLEVLPAAGHLSNVEAADRFNDELRRFCLSPS